VSLLGQQLVNAIGEKPACSVTHVGNRQLIDECSPSGQAQNRRIIAGIAHL